MKSIDHFANIMNSISILIFPSIAQNFHEVCTFLRFRILALSYFCIMHWLFSRIKNNAFWSDLEINFCELYIYIYDIRYIYRSNYTWFALSFASFLITAFLLQLYLSANYDDAVFTLHNYNDRKWYIQIVLYTSNRFIISNFEL